MYIGRGMYVFFFVFPIVASFRFISFLSHRVVCLLDPCVRCVCVCVCVCKRTIFLFLSLYLSLSPSFVISSLNENVPSPFLPYSPLPPRKQQQTNNIPYTAVVFFPRLANLANRTMLAISLGFAAGVMLYVSLVQIYGKKTYGNFYQDGEGRFDEQTSLMYSTFSFFGGCILMMVLDKIVDWLLKYSEHEHEHSEHSEQRREERGSSGSENNNNNDEDEDDEDVLLEDESDIDVNNNNNGKNEPAVAGIIDGLAKHPVEELDEMKNNFITKIKIEQEGQMQGQDHHNHHHQDQEQEQVQQVVAVVDMDVETSSPTTEQQQNHHHHQQQQQQQHRNNKTKLRSMGFAMALAIAIHNFPEGMASFLAYKADPALGVALAIGIALHNIPEGLCVSMPLYYATSKRWYSFWWGTLSGLSEPLGAVFAWLVLRNDDGLDGTTNGVLFGVVSGMMTVISIHELLPNAHKYALNGSTVTYSFLCGAFIIALSIMLFPPE